MEGQKIMEGQIIAFPRPLLKIRDLARMLNVSLSTVKAWSAQGRLDAYRIRVGAQYRYDPAKVEARLKTGEFATNG